jgi:hypothetical protein
MIVSAGSGVDTTVGVGNGVNARVGEGINISVEAGLVDVFAAMGEAEAVGLPSVALQALVRRITSMKTYDFLDFIF